MVPLMSNFLQMKETIAFASWFLKGGRCIVVFHISVPFEYRILLKFHYETEVGDIWQTIEFFAFV